MLMNSSAVAQLLKREQPGLQPEIVLGCSGHGTDVSSLATDGDRLPSGRLTTIRQINHHIEDLGEPVPIGRCTHASRRLHLVLQCRRLVRGSCSLGEHR